MHFSFGKLLRYTAACSIGCLSVSSYADTFYQILDDHTHLSHDQDETFKHKIDTTLVKNATTHSNVLYINNPLFEKHKQTEVFQETKCERKESVLRNHEEANALVKTYKSQLLNVTHVSTPFLPCEESEQEQTAKKDIVLTKNSMEEHIQTAIKQRSIKPLLDIVTVKAFDLFVNTPYGEIICSNTDSVLWTVGAYTAGPSRSCLEIQGTY